MQICKEIRFTEILCLEFFNLIVNSIYSTPPAHRGYEILCPQCGKYGYQIWHFKIDNNASIQEIEVLIKWVRHTLLRIFFS